MVNKLAKYRVHADQLEAVKKAVREFVTAVGRLEADTLRYDAYQTDDPREFIHFMTFRDAAAEEKHRTSPHVKKFVNALYPACKEEPQFISLNLL